MKSPRDPEENDIPFFRNELSDSPGTMDKPLDTADAPGKADSEFIEEAPSPDNSRQTRSNTGP
jgi:hypothetical protein